MFGLNLLISHAGHMHIHICNDLFSQSYGAGGVNGAHTVIQRPNLTCHACFNGLYLTENCVVYRKMSTALQTEYVCLEV